MRIFALLVIFGIFVSACETIKGVGRDIENAGEALDEATD
ncbi:MAG: entericidin A/B family lipoprotein [Pseudomonadota bacterium]